MKDHPNVTDPPDPAGGSEPAPPARSEAQEAQTADDEPTPPAPPVEAQDLSPRHRRDYRGMAVVGAALVLLTALLALAVLRRNEPIHRPGTPTPTAPALAPEHLLREADAAAAREERRRRLAQRARALAEQRARKEAREKHDRSLTHRPTAPRPLAEPQRRPVTASRFTTLSPLATTASPAAPRTRPPDNGDARSTALAETIARLEAYRGTERADPPPDVASRSTSSRPVHAPIQAQLEKPAPLVLRAGTTITATLLTHVASNAPGPVQAIVNHDVHGNGERNAVLIPAGSRLMGVSAGSPSFGDRRLDIAWHRLQFADGTTVVLDQTTTVDGRGTPGIEDRVNNRWRSFYAHAFLTSITGAVAQASQSRGSRGNGTVSVGEDAAAALGRNLAQVTRDVADRQLRRAPVLEVRAGQTLAVALTQDLVFGMVPSSTRPAP